MCMIGSGEAKRYAPSGISRLGPKRISLYRSVIAVAQDLDSDHGIHDSLHANP